MINTFLIVILSNFFQTGCSGHKDIISFLSVSIADGIIRFNIKISVPLTFKSSIKLD